MLARGCSPCQRLPERFEDAVHVRAVRRQSPCPPDGRTRPLRRARAPNCSIASQSPETTADVRRVDDRHRVSRARPRLQQRSHLRLRQLNREPSRHAPQPPQSACYAAPPSAHRPRGQRARHHRRRDLTLAVARSPRPAAPRDCATPPQARSPSQTAPAAPRRPARAAAPPSPSSPPSTARTDQPVCGNSAASHAVDRIREHRRLREQRAAHPRPLAALAREHEHHAAERPRRPGRHRRMGPPLRQRIERVLRLPDIIGLDGGARIEVRAVAPPPCEPPPPDPSPGATAATPPIAPPANAAPLRPGPTPEAAASQAAP